MDDQLWRINVEVRSRRLLNDYVKHMGLSGRQLAVRAGLGHAIVAHLLNGTRKTCNSRTARLIEEALGCPRNLLFTERVSTVSPSNGREPIPA